MNNFEMVNTPFGEMKLRADTDGFTLNTTIEEPITVYRVLYSTTFRSSWDYLKDASVYENLGAMFRKDNLNNATYAARKKFVTTIVEFMAQGYENGDFSALIERTESDKRAERISELRMHIALHEATLADMKAELENLTAAAHTTF